MFLLSSLTTVLLAQVVGGVQSKGMDMNTRPYGFVKEIKAEPNAIIGNTYLHEGWFFGSIEFINGALLADKGIRYNIKADVVEIRLDAILKGSDGKNVKRFELLNSLTQEKEQYVSASDFIINNTKLVGFLRELKVGYYSLYSKTTVILIKGSYVRALDMGEEDDEYRKQTTYYLAKDKELIELSTNRKRFASVFFDSETEILKYIKEHNLSLKNERDLIKIVSFVNSLNN